MVQYFLKNKSVVLNHYVEIELHKLSSYSVQGLLACMMKLNLLSIQRFLFVSIFCLFRFFVFLLSQSQQESLVTFDFLLQLNQTKQQRKLFTPVQ